MNWTIVSNNPEVMNRSISGWRVGWLTKLVVRPTMLETIEKAWPMVS